MSILENVTDFLDDIAECLTGSRKLEAGSMDLASGKRYRTIAKELAKLLRARAQILGNHLVVYYDARWDKRDGKGFCVDQQPDGSINRFPSARDAARFVENELYRIAGRKPE